MTNLTTYINKIEALRDSYRELKNNATDSHKQTKYAGIVLGFNTVLYDLFDLQCSGTEISSEEMTMKLIDYREEFMIYLEEAYDENNHKDELKYKGAISAFCKLLTELN